MAFITIAAIRFRGNLFVLTVVIIFPIHLFIRSFQAIFGHDIFHIAAPSVVIAPVIIIIVRLIVVADIPSAPAAYVYGEPVEILHTLVYFNLFANRHLYPQPITVGS